MQVVHEPIGKAKADVAPRRAPTGTYRLMERKVEDGEEEEERPKEHCWQGEQGCEDILCGIRRRRRLIDV